MIAIAAVDKNWAIGNKGDLLVSLPEDQKGVFRVYTSGNTVVFGRKTLMTFKEQKLLPRRVNIILSRNPKFEKEGAVILHSTEELKRYQKEHPDEKIFVIGGAEVYKTLLPLCDEAIITKVNNEYEADAYFPDLDEDEEWELVNMEDEILSVKGVSFNVCHYKRK
ncbi:MAG: dihydrofolate reductase [Clostridiales bacterium]|nr:dihydrofolate reductase [Clostridiales bacterium]